MEEQTGTPNFSTGTPPVSSQPVAPGKSRMVLGIVIGLVVVLVLGAGGVFAYTKLSVPTPEKALSKMKEQLNQVKSFEFAGKVKIKAKMNRNPLLGVLSGSGEESAPEATNLPVNVVDLEFSGVNAGAKSFSLTTKAVMSTEDDLENKQAYGLDVRVLDKITYVRINQVPSMGLIGMFTGGLKGKWIKIDAEEAKSDDSLLTGMLGANSPASLELTEEQKQQLWDEIVRLQIVRMDKKLGTEKVNGETAYHYGFTVDKAKLPELVKFMNQLRKMPANDADVTELQKNLDVIKNLGGEIWLGKKDFLPRQILFVMSLSDKDMGSVDGTLTLQVKNYNQALKVVVPEQSQTLEELMMEMLGGAFGASVGVDPTMLDGAGLGQSDVMEIGDSRVKARDSQRLSNVRQVQTALELYYTDNSSYPITKVPLNLGIGTASCLNQKGFYVGTCENPYIAVVPRDPNGNYTYESADGKSYKIEFTLEGNVNDLRAGKIVATSAGIAEAK